jgi:PAS domain S-box-containing protein
MLQGEKIMEANQAFCDLVGYDRRSLTGLPSALDLVLADERPRVLGLLRRYLAGEDVGRRFAVPVMTASGAQANLDLAVKSVGGTRRAPRLLVIANDVTDRRAYEQRLHYQTRLLEAIAETSLDGILVVAADGRMLYFNRRFIDMWGIPPSVVSSRSDDAALAAVRDMLIEPQAFLDRVSYLYDHPLEESNDELRLRDGRAFERYSAPVLDADGQAQGRVWFFRDVTQPRGAQAASELLALSGELFASPLDVEGTLSQLAELVVPRMADWAAVDVVDEAKTFRRVGVAHVQPAGVELLRELNRRYPLRARDGRLRGQVVATLEPIALFQVNDDELRSLARDDRHFRMLQRLGVTSAVWIPLIVRGEAVGVLSAGFGAGGRRYTPADVEVLRELARRAALALDNAFLYRAVKRAETRQAALATLGQQALGGTSSDELMQAAAESIAQVMEVPFVEVLRMTPDRRTLQLVAGVGWRDGLVGKATVRSGTGSQGGYTLATVGPVILEDLATEKRFTPPALLAEHNVVSGVTVVVGGAARPHGVLGAHTTERRVFADDDVNFLQAVANVLAAAIDRHADEDRLNSLASAEKARAAQLRSVIESIGDAVVVCDAVGSVLLANPAAESLLGSHLATGMAGIFHAFEWPAGHELGELPPSEGIELRLAASAGPDSDERWIELSAFPVRSDQPELGPEGGTILLLRDVTTTRNARSVRDAFLGVLSHELRTPVTTIYGGSEVLARRSATLSEDSRQELYQDIRAEADRLYRLVENLLVLSRVERQGLHVETEPVLLQRLVPRVAEAESTRWPSARWVTKVPPGLPPVAAEETYIEQVLRNLLGNAAKYGGDGQVTVTARDNGDTVSVTVRDAGQGLAEEEIESLFDLFYRSPSVLRQASGAGIGLFVSRQLVNAMGGRMWACNNLHGGAEFGFEIPVFA